MRHVTPSYLAVPVSFLICFSLTAQPDRTSRSRDLVWPIADMGVSGPVGGCPGAGSCCESNGTPGCNNVPCCEAVCTVDAFCCNTQWDATCVGLAIGGSGVCQEPEACQTSACPGTGSCCEANDSPGCEDANCCGLVCAADTTCCDTAWDAECAGLASRLCEAKVCGDFVCPGTGPCCQDHETQGCDDEDCCNAVCKADSFCCDTRWDIMCVAAALELCPQVCPANKACPGEGSCCEPDTTPGCDDEDCCNLICSNDSYCCDIVWDSKCAEAAIEFCDPNVCGKLICPGEGDCCQSNGTPGCDNSDCCDVVCVRDAFCCQVEWDLLCVDAATTEPACDCPVTVLAWGSHGVHAEIGPAVLDIPESVEFSEPRLAGINLILVAFSGPIDPTTAIPANVSVTGCDVDNMPIGAIPSTITVTTNVPDNDVLGITFDPKLPGSGLNEDPVAYTITLSNIHSAAGTPVIGSLTRTVIAQIADVNNDQRVNTTDINAARTIRDLTAGGIINPISMFEVRSDVNMDGRANTTDMNAIRTIRDDAGANDASSIACP